MLESPDPLQWFPGDPEPPSAAPAASSSRAAQTNRLPESRLLADSLQKWPAWLPEPSASAGQDPREPDHNAPDTQTNAFSGWWPGLDPGLATYSRPRTGLEENARRCP